MNREHPNAELVLEAFEAIQRGDIQTFWASQAEDVTATVFGRGDLAGAFAGRDVRDWIPCQIYEKLSMMAPGTDPPQPKRARPTHVLADDTHVVVIYEVEGQDADHPLRGVVVCMIQDGKITDTQHFDPVVAGGGLEALR